MSPVGARGLGLFVPTFISHCTHPGMGSVTSVKEPAPSQMPHASWPRSPWSAVRLLTRHAGVYRARADAALGQGRHSACWSMGRQLVQMSVLGPFSEAWAQISVSLGPAWPGALGWGRWWHFLGDRLWEAWMLPCCDKCHGEGGSPAITPRIMRPSSFLSSRAQI